MSDELPVGERGQPGAEAVLAGLRARGIASAKDPARLKLLDEATGPMATGDTLPGGSRT